MIDIVDQMEKLARDIHYRKQQHRVFSGTIPTDKQKAKAKSCWICERGFDDSDVKVLDHCHFKGNFLGWAHEVGNVNRKTQNFTAIIAHNLSHYDLHHPCNALHNCHSRNRFTIIPNTDETYISLTLKVFIEERAGRKNRLIQVYGDLRFLDSFRFMKNWFVRKLRWKNWSIHCQTTVLEYWISILKIIRRVMLKCYTAKDFILILI